VDIMGLHLPEGVPNRVVGRHGHKVRRHEAGHPEVLDLVPLHGEPARVGGSDSGGPYKKVLSSRLNSRDNGVPRDRDLSRSSPGVYFRANCAEKAESLGLHGYVRNLPDGSVEAVFEEDRPGIEACINWNKTSQPYARVETVEVTWSEARGDARGFHVRH